MYDHHDEDDYDDCDEIQLVICELCMNHLRMTSGDTKTVNTHTATLYVKTPCSSGSRTFSVHGALSVFFKLRP
jgi:hypothetical protein